MRPPELPRPLRILPELAEHAERIFAAARAPNTRRARSNDWQVFTAWCAAHGEMALPATVDTVISFLLACTMETTADARKPATLKRYLSTISVAHGAAGHPSPTRDVRVGEAMDGIRRTMGMAQRLAAPLTSDLLERIQTTNPSDRNWLILCFGQASACRRSELCALNVEDLTFNERGVAIRIGKSKTDQEAKGTLIGVERRAGPLCPVLAVERWLQVCRATHGPLFVALTRNGAPSGRRLGARVINAVVKAAVAGIGIDPADYSAHSLRAGWVTDRRRAGRKWIEIMAHTRHKELKTVQGYARYERDPFQRIDE